MHRPNSARAERAIQGDANIDRRRLLSGGCHALGGIALASLLARAPKASASEPDRTALHFHPVARRAISICLVGGLSQVDSFDYKPELTRLHGKPPPTDEKPDVFFGRVGRLRRSDWEFHQRGESGLWISDLFPHLAQLADRLTIVRSMVSETGNHTPALFLSNSGFQLNGFPSVGSWLSYGLGSLSDELPTFVVIPDARGAPSGGASGWSSGFLPSRHQGVLFTPGPQPVRDLFPPEAVPDDAATKARDLLQMLHEKQLGRLGNENDLLTARLRAYELAARMQLSVPEATDLSRECPRLTEMYGLDTQPTADFARSCLLARRLLERGVRFVQLYAGGPLGGKPRTSWDGHEDMVANHAREAARVDRPIAALLRDLEQRGLLADTILTCTTEFGRTPFTQSGPDELGKGRDHNNAGFSIWMAGAGLRPGIAYGQTDEMGYRAVVNPMTWHDLHATLLHLFGLDHERLTFYHNGIERRLTNVHGEVIPRLLA